MLILFTTLVTRLTRIAQSNSSQDVVSEVMVFFYLKKPHKNTGSQIKLTVFIVV